MMEKEDLLGFQFHILSVDTHVQQPYLLSTMANQENLCKLFAAHNMDESSPLGE